MPRGTAFVDASKDFDAYQGVGIGNIGDLTPRVGLVKPELSGKQWLDYMMNVVKISPNKDNIEGVKRLGGSFAIRGEKIIFQHFDSIPGDDAPIEDVLVAVGA